MLPPLSTKGILSRLQSQNVKPQLPGAFFKRFSLVSLNENLPLLLQHSSVSEIGLCTFRIGKSFWRGTNPRSRYFSMVTSIMAIKPHHVTILALSLALLASIATAAPFPAPDLKMCGNAFNTTEVCCILPQSQSKEPIKKFQMEYADLPLRYRRPAHLLDEAYIAKYERAMALMRALPDTDGRSWNAQWRLHCAYCNNHLYYPGKEYPLEIHQSWFFLPWHRMYLFFQERILASLINDPTFALPFWNWDSQNRTAPFPNTIPDVYFNNASVNSPGKNSSLWDPDRNPCSSPPRLVEFQQFIGCAPRPFPDFTRFQNSHMMWTQMVSVGVTPQIMAGGIYRFGDYGARGMGAIEARPHSPMHAWTNVKDMGTFFAAASDPVFAGLHANMDRLWELWRTLPGSYRGDVTDPDYLDSEFTFYDENGEQVSATIKDFLDIEKHRVKYEEVTNAWVENGAPQVDGIAAWEFCAADNSNAGLSRTIREAPIFKAPMEVVKGPLTFKVYRKPNKDMNRYGEELLELKFANFTWNKQHTLNVFAYLPTAQYENTSIGCHEYLGTLQNFPHPGASPNMKEEMVFRIGLRRKLEMMGRAHLRQLVLTFVGQSYASVTSPGESGTNITSAAVIYAKE